MLSFFSAITGPSGMAPPWAVFSSLQPIFETEMWGSFFADEPLVLLLLAACLGACWTSFSGVMVDRLPRKLGIAFGTDGFTPVPPDGTASLSSPSKCVCGERLTTVALIPVFGWLLVRGRHSCGALVPAVYPLLEAVVAVVSAGLAFHFGPTLTTALVLPAFWLAVAVSWMDAKTEWVPDRLSVPLLLMGLLWSPFAPMPLDRIYGLVASLTVLWCCFAWVGFRNKMDTMSAGDLMLIAAGGAWLGFPMVPAFLGMSALIFAAYTMPIRIRHWRSRRAAGADGHPPGAPMGPAICAALFACMLLPGLALSPM